MKILRSRSSEMAEVGERLKQRNEGEEKREVTKPRDGEIKKWFKERGKNFWTILLVVGAIAVFYRGIYSSTPWKTPSTGEIGVLAWSHWLWSFIFVGILFILVERIGDVATKKTVRVVLSAVVFLIFIGFPIWNWTATSRSKVPLASAPVSTWQKITLPPGGESWVIQIPVGKRIEKKGRKFQVHVSYSDGRKECVQVFGSDPDCPDGPITGVYFTNKADEMNTISYAFAPL